MARPSYGPEAKKRTLELFTALLDYANSELDSDDETLLEWLRPQIQTHWQSDRRLVIRTKVRFLEALSKLAGFLLTGEQIKEALRRLADFLEILEDNRPNRGGSETWHFTLTLWHKRFDKVANLQRFDREWESRRPSKSKQMTEKVEPDTETGECSDEQELQDFWWQLCRDCLEAQQYLRLTTNPLTTVYGLAFDLDEVYVPLGLVERKHQDRRDTDITPERGSQLYEPSETDDAQILTLEQFLERLQQPGLTKRIAIVGEPGSGKTTLLQKIASWLLDARALPIWISLADLQSATLEEYLLGDWLKVATRKVIIPEELPAALGEQFNQGRVWLLLDAVDEMAMDGSTALAGIARQLRGWVADANVILTCRLNVWDGGKNVLETFETYRNLTFSYGDLVTEDRVGQFIDRWFHNKSDLGGSLRAELDKPERKRVRDAVKNPLRLALLVRSWSLTPGTLPNTKTALYQQFVEAIYEWKQDRFPTTPVQRRQLNQALGQLAFQALSQEKSKFRLSQSLIYEVFGEKAIELLPLALQLGWLNQVGISAISGEKVYAFYHPTFQEYFAAQAIADWHFFLPRSKTPPQPSPPTGREYELTPVFSSHWREVFLLWLGRTDIAPADKTALIQFLIGFDDGCGGFYSYQAYFLAAAGLAEFPECPETERIIVQLLCWRFSEFNIEQQTWQYYPSPVVQGARVALLQTDRNKAIAALEQFVGSSISIFACWNAAYSLGKTFDPGNGVAIAAILRLLEIIRNEPLRLNICDSLGKIDPGNSIAISTITELMVSAQQDSVRRKAAYCLGKLNPGNITAISTLEKLIILATSHSVRFEAAKSLLLIDPDNIVAATVIQPQHQTTGQIRRKRRVKQKDIQKEISALEQRLASAIDASSRGLAERLGRLQPGHSLAIEVLIQMLESQQSAALYRQISISLKDILLEEQLDMIVSRLKEYCVTIEQGEIVPQTLSCYKLLWHCAQLLPYGYFHAAWNR